MSPREYDRECTDLIAPAVRVHLGYSHDRGAVTHFVIHLEYRVGDDWREVVRYDHDSESEHGHDVEDEGLHIDVYRDGEPLRTEYVAPAMPASVALDRAEDCLAKNADTFIQRFEEWHGIRNP